MSVETKIVISEEEYKMLIGLYNNAQNTPVISLTGKPEDSWSKHAWDDVREFQKKLGAKYGYNWEQFAINEKREVVAF